MADIYAINTEGEISWFGDRQYQLRFTQSFSTGATITDADQSVVLRLKFVKKQQQAEQNRESGNLGGAWSGANGVPISVASGRSYSNS